MKNISLSINQFMKSKWLLITILVIAGFLRLWRVGSNPPGLTPDEAALGYNAYSILKTGRDEFGTKLPIIFKSFGDYKPGLYVYLDTPFVAAMGLNEFSTRLPSGIAGILSVYLIYLICCKLFNKKIGNFALAVAALNPWLIYFSRGAWEANVSLTLTLAGIYFFIRSFTKPKYLIFSAVAFALTLITYQGAKLSTLIVLLILLAVYFKDFLKFFVSAKKELAISLVLGLLIIYPIILTFFNGQTFRLTIFSIFSYRRPVSEVQSLLSEGNEKIGDVNYYLFHSEGLNYVRAILGRYFNNFSGRFLFFEGDWANPISTAPYQGVLLLSDLLFLPLGLLAIFKNKLQKGHYLFILWLTLAPFSVALSRDDINAVRDLNLAVPLIVAVSFGLVEAFEWIQKRKNRFIYYLFVFGICGFSLVYFLDAYFVHLPAHNSNYWRYGYREAVRIVVPLETKYKNIVFEQSFNQPYIYLLFYEAMDNSKNFNVQKYQKQEKLVNSQYIGDVGFENEIDNIQFKNIDWQVLKNQPGTLVIGSPVSLPPDFLNDSSLVKEIKYLNGRDVAFDIVEMK
jgi:4-amino-4-deoxy-L-arabinose transferase-like glycosyltransferase